MTFNGEELRSNNTEGPNAAMNGSIGGIKKKRGGSSRSGGVKWDESNLQENEIIKATMQPMTKIKEPKTPYHGPSACDSDSDSAMQMDQLALDREGSQEIGGSGISAEQANGESHCPAQPIEFASFAEGRLQEHCLQLIDGQAEGQTVIGQDTGRSDVSESGDEVSEAAAHVRFEELRKKHYQLPKAVLAHEDNAEGEELQGDTTDQGIQ